MKRQREEVRIQLKPWDTMEKDSEENPIATHFLKIV